MILGLVGKKGRITRPQNAFILFRKDLQDKLKTKTLKRILKKFQELPGIDHINSQIKHIILLP
ncbi:high mobility group box domain-containing protein [Rhizophagus irregularis DAOM 181602=DAOM 197198]|nr:high mobility group box domain-containing protein [Rhizophagus irregularis DAOM 181602=DAOM 197198]